MNEVYIIAAKRTAIGRYGGCFQNMAAIELGASAIQAAVSQSDLAMDSVESVIIGNVLSAGLGQAPARQAARLAGLPDSACATTVNKVCASGLKAIAMLAQDIRSGDVAIGIAGGMESMSRVPHYVAQARFGIGYGDKALVDGLSHDGLTDAYTQESMGVLADRVALAHGITRTEADDFAARSFESSMEAWSSGRFDDEVAPVSVAMKRSETLEVSKDEGYDKVDFGKMRQLKPAFTAGGVLTAANSSPLSDGASAVVLAAGDVAVKSGKSRLARIVAYAEAEQDPALFVATPALAAEKVLRRAGLSVPDIGLFEVNEAFSIVPLIFAKAMDVPIERVNVAGGAVALGHPLGASGARIVTTLLYALKQRGIRYGLAAICNGGGGASAIIVENMDGQ